MELMVTTVKERSKVTIVCVNTQEDILVFNNVVAGSKGIGRNPT